jgi:hypothetical protein
MCHRIAALEYGRHYALGHGGTFEVVTGYALYRDGLWRQHSWNWDGKRVIEPNNRPLLYFGVILNPMEAFHFVYCEVWVHLPGCRESEAEAATAA